MTKLSIIVPVYKVPPPYLRQCLDSLAAVKLQDIEIIMVDDGSPDCCGEICDEYSSSDRRFVAIHTENAGVSAARNRGIAESKGEWISFVDADDFVEPDAIENLIDTACETNSDILFFTGYLNKGLKQQEGHFRYADKKAFERGERFELIQRVMTIYSHPVVKEEILPIDAAWGKLYRGALLKKYNITFPEGIPVSEDGLFLLYAIREAERVVYSDKCVYHYRFNEESAMNKYRPAADIEQSRYLEKLSEYVQSMDEIDLENTYYLRVLVSMRHCMEQKFFHEKNNNSHFENRREFIELIKCEPYKTALRSKKLYEISSALFLRTLLIRIRFFGLLLSMLKIKKLMSGAVNRLKGNDT